MTRLLAVLPLITVAVVHPQLAAADPGPVDGSPCVQEEMNTTSVSPSGAPLRCAQDASGYTWRTDQGVAEVDAGTATQQAWIDCLQSSQTPSQCAHTLRGAPPPATAATTSFIPGTGTFQVGYDVVSGVYQSRGGVHKNPCSWSISAADDPSSIIDQGVSFGPQQLKITANQRGTLETSECAPWNRSQAGSPVF